MPTHVTTMSMYGYNATLQAAPVGFLRGTI